jgi:hypothetical protein
VRKIFEDAGYSVNENSRKGSFIVMLDGKHIINLVDQVRPFPELKALDVEAICQAYLK